MSNQLIKVHGVYSANHADFLNRMQESLRFRAPWNAKASPKSRMVRVGTFSYGALLVDRSGRIDFDPPSPLPEGREYGFLVFEDGTMLVTSETTADIERMIDGETE